MVEDYRLTRDAELRLAEGAHRQDEEWTVTMTFKRWLTMYEWPRQDCT
jgi:hypothetical protein